MCSTLYSRLAEDGQPAYNEAMPLSDALRKLQDGGQLRGSIELDDRLLGWTASFTPPRTLTILLDELLYDEPIPFDLVDEPASGLNPP